MEFLFFKKEELCEPNQWLAQLLLTGGDSPPGDIWQCLETFWGCNYL